MVKTLIASALAVCAVSSVPAMAQAVTAKPGNCAIWLEEASKTVAADGRFTGVTKTEIVGAFDSFAKAQRQIVADGMDKTYADSAAFGWDKAKVDQMIAQNEAQVRAGFKTATMEDGRLYMDHILAVNNCAEANKMDSQFGMSREAFIAALTKAYNIVLAG
ncbi:MAG: hypothetical protein AAGF20_13735 [Pseudomonadota bacterium]